MAKLLLSLDHYFYYNNGSYYYASQREYDFYHRYLEVFEELRIAARVIEEIEVKEGRIPIDKERVDFFPLPIFHGPKEYIGKYLEIGKAMKGVTKGCDAAILRLPSTVAQRISKQVIANKIPYACEIVFDAADGAATANNPLEKILWKIIDYQMRKTCYGAEGVSCVTQYYLQKRYFSQKDNHFESYYSSGGIPSSFYTSARIFPSKKILTIAHVDLQIGLHSRKGTDELLHAVALLKKDNIDVNISFAGDDWGDNANKIRKYAENIGIGGQVDFPGYLSATQMSDFLDKADLFVFPTKAEGLPRSIIEAMAKGLPVVTTPASGNPELIKPHFLVAYEDIETLAERIKELVTRPASYEQASFENFTKAQEYKAQVLQKRRVEFYKKLKDTIKK